MKKLLLTFMALVLVTTSMFAAQVVVTMNAKSKLIKSLVNIATNEPVDVGNPTSNKYTFEAADGSYLLTATAADSVTVSGTIQLDIDADHTTFAIFSPEITVKNSGWEYGTDYTFDLKLKPYMRLADGPMDETPIERVTLGSDAKIAFTADLPDELLLKDIDFEDVTQLLPVGIMLLAMPISGSIGHGIGLSLISYTCIKVFTGKAKEVSVLTYVLSAIFLIKFFLAV